MSRSRVRFARALGWTALAAVTLLLHALGRGPLGPPPLLHPHGVLIWWQQRGPLLATFAAARQALWWAGCYFLALWTLAAVASWRHSLRLIRGMAGCRLPGTRTAVRASLGASALGAVLVGSAVPSFAAGGPHRPTRPARRQARRPCCATWAPTRPVPQPACRARRPSCATPAATKPSPQPLQPSCPPLPGSVVRRPRRRPRRQERSPRRRAAQRRGARRAAPDARRGPARRLHQR